MMQASGQVRRTSHLVNFGTISCSIQTKPTTSELEPLETRTMTMEVQVKCKPYLT